MIAMLIVLWCLVGAVIAGQPEKTKTQEFSGTAPIGAYTFPPNFAAGRSPGAGHTKVGIEVTRDQLTNPVTEVELIVEVSYDGGASWPIGCVSTSTCRCHDGTQDESMPVNTAWCSMRVLGGETLGMNGQPVMISALECLWTRATDNNTRMRGRANVCGAPATGAVSLTWR